ncbi:hypothetical protein Kpol_299p2 [Vanderwaltozyma polyspora DSM 70294]|uniref:Urea amidolyase n=1 Tax=Vanderwaltozyma polyspora (strain ATCC 22028 / DSM 70294 / BCRC 21397 / CBS 2163 / NBRC 10782 / NRRL Y-8283 / UCD 57-17) TaxID=436907 RepID=A7TSW0_VANPO|nr:uncharacterized protein Kpol_299p2 [Vanderwaltozyma polyspora DSM 70294]EDO14642.1 hypothetical protein Kpol_299p2 [Vanderwaltozyma polyspora DSM 70294]
MSKSSFENTLGWTIDDWLSFHKKHDYESSLSLLKQLLRSQKVAPIDCAWISLVDESYLESQWLLQSARDNRSQLPLLGVPIAVKDNIDVKNCLTTAGCPSFAYNPISDSTVVRLLKNAGAIILGKTNLDQFATGLVGTRSPYGKTPCVFNQDYVSGGSSAGSASVVARGIVPLALGTDTAGSGRVPAALNNIIGLKPTRGIVSCNGVVPACKSLDCVSIFSLNLKDAETCLRTIANPDYENDEYSRSLPSNPKRKFDHKLNIAIPKNIPNFGDDKNSFLFEDAVNVLKEIDANIVELDFQPLLDLAECLYNGPWVVERYLATKEFLERNPPLDSLDPTVLSIIESAKKFNACDVFKSEYKRKQILQKIKNIFKDIDVLCVPTCPLNPTFKEVEQEPIKVNSIQGTWTNFVNLADLSAIAIPAGFRNDGLPNGITLISRKFNDYALLELANRYLNYRTPFSVKAFGIFTDELKNKDKKKYELYGPEVTTHDSITVAVVGAHLKGFALNWQLDKVNATFIKSSKTAKKYELYALPKAGPVLKPGLRRIGNAKGTKIELELYSIPLETFGIFMSMIPEPLGIGSVELENGEWVKSFICEEIGYIQEGSKNISSYGGYKNYMTYLKEKESVKIFNSILVANRGEIAVRIIKSLKKLKIKSVAIYSEIDKNSQHVHDADIAIPLIGSTTADTYLNIEQIIKIAKETSSEGIIPGYGFLSENAEFSDTCKENGITFIGPSGQVIRDLGLKHSARELAKNANVPLVPGSSLISNVQEVKEVAQALGYPVMIKSTAGGGGIGLQKVENEEQIESMFATVKHLGETYFGNSGVFLEKFIENARHVEVQILGDGKGKAIAIGERDCSLQRRNQKIIEETPPPNLPESTLIKMRNAAESLGALTKYLGAGTVEYIYDQDRDEFYFLEVNTRLQVEHPITEVVTGLDLVEWMVKLAAGNSLSLTRDSIKVSGVSIEARLYAENPVKNFLPSPGKLTTVEFPSWTRVDSWVSSGSVISTEYDPTLAKIIVHGNNRSDAITKLINALSETVIQGCITNKDYLMAVLKSEFFNDATMTTHTLNSFQYSPNVFEIITPGAHTSVQDFPGRKSYWRIGVPPSGPMDSYSFRLANKIVGNHESAAGLEITLIGPTIRFHCNTLIALTGGEADCQLNGKNITMYSAIQVNSGDKLTIGKIVTGCRIYLSVKDGIKVPEYLGSKSTFTLGEFGGYNGRVLKTGDLIPIVSPEDIDLSKIVSNLPKSIMPNISRNGKWEIGVLCGPHGSPDFFEESYISEFFSSSWKVHYNSNRFGIKLIGPKPRWVRNDGGEAGLHPSNAHDYVYSLGAINFTGDEPVIITCDGPSLGGFVCQVVIPEAELWKVGQVKSGDSIKFHPISYEGSRKLFQALDFKINYLKSLENEIELNQVILSKFENPILREIHSSDHDSVLSVKYRQAGDRYILVEFGENKLDFNISYHIHSIIKNVEELQIKGIVEMSQGVRSFLIEFEPNRISQKNLLEVLITVGNGVPFTHDWKISSKLIRLPMAFEDSKTLGCVKRYQETIRSSAPWLPNNVDFVASANEIKRENVYDMMYSARFMVMGLGDVYLSSPCAVPIDPRQRYLGSKYNPARTFTEKGVVGLGGMYMCIYAASSPGGYQLVGRTIPIWDTLMLGSHSATPWMLSPFDQIEFFVVSENELDTYVEQFDSGTFEIDVSNILFDNSVYEQWLKENKESIDAHDSKVSGEERSRLATLLSEVNVDKVTIEEPTKDDLNKYDENACLIYSEYCGRFWKSLVNVGDIINVGDGLIVVEAMKTEMTVESQKSGMVKEILHKNGDIVNEGEIVVVLEPIK